MPEKAPSGASGLDLRTTVQTIPGAGTRTVLEYSGPVDELEAQQDSILSAGVIDGSLAQTELTHLNGRGTLRVNYERVWFQIDPEDQHLQELFQFDVIRSIFLAKHFADLTDAQVLAVRTTWENQISGTDLTPIYDAWALKQQQLFGHLIRGQESYAETAYEFVQTWRTGSSKLLNIAASNPNTVQTLPPLSGVMANLIDALPDGEWLKKPTTVTSEGRGFFNVRLIYQWAPKWSIIYGGTFTGV